MVSMRYGEEGLLEGTVVYNRGGFDRIVFQHEGEHWIASCKKGDEFYYFHVEDVMIDVGIDAKISLLSTGVVIIERHDMGSDLWLQILELYAGGERQMNYGVVYTRRR